jgi:hypothetical protein
MSVKINQIYTFQSSNGLVKFKIIGPRGDDSWNLQIISGGSYAPGRKSWCEDGFLVDDPRVKLDEVSIVQSILDLYE